MAARLSAPTPSHNTRPGTSQATDRGTPVAAPLAGCNVLLDGRSNEQSPADGRQVHDRSTCPRAAGATEALNPFCWTLAPPVRARRNARSGTGSRHKRALWPSMDPWRPF